MAWRNGILLLLIIQTASLSWTSDIRGLRGKGDYREIEVSWEYPGRSWFLVHYCELQAWGSSRCKAKTVDSDSGVERNGSVDYSASLDGLRMSTNYSVRVEEGRRTRRLARARTIVVSTKGFSARAVSCLPEASEVEVETGPYFQGRIGVESGGCAVEGDPASPRTSYLLRIWHADCGSTLNQTAASTFVLVQESSHILTHSTRRFLVLCTFQPETLTVRAGLNLPHTADGIVEPSLNDISENDVQALPLRQEQMPKGDELGSVLGGVAALLGLVAVGIILWKYLPNGGHREEDTEVNYNNLAVSAGEEIGGSARQETGEVEEVNEQSKEEPLTETNNPLREECHAVSI